MTEDKKDGREKKLKNKGVNFKGGMAASNYFSDTDSFTHSLGAVKSISRVKHDLQTVIDLMGPSTPQYLQSPSNDGDNELSATTAETNKRSVKKEEEPSETYTESNTDKTVPPDITLQEDTDISIVADKNSTTFELQEPFHQYVCPPPVLPANVLYNSECMCPQIASYIHHGPSLAPYTAGSQKEVKKLGRHRNFFYNIFKHLTSSLTEKKYEYSPGDCEYYKMNIKESQTDNRPPRRLVFDLVSDLPKQDCRIEEGFDDPYCCQIRNTRAKDLKNFNNERLTRETQQNDTFILGKESNQTLQSKASRKLDQKTMWMEGNEPTRVDVYYFDRGDADFLKTTDNPPVVTTETLAERTEAYTTKFWAEIFGTMHIGVSFGISFVLQFFRFFLHSFMRPLTIGLVQLGTDYFFKPCIATVFNGVIQPPLIFLYNVCASCRDVCRPLAEGMGFFLREMTTVIRAFRIVDVRREKISEFSSSQKKDNVVDKTEKTELVA